MDDTLPEAHMIMSLREALTEQSQSDGPQELVTNIRSRLFIQISLGNFGSKSCELRQRILINDMPIRLNIHMLLFFELEIECS